MIEIKLQIKERADGKVTVELASDATENATDKEYRAANHFFDLITNSSHTKEIVTVTYDKPKKEES